MSWPVGHKGWQEVIRYRVRRLSLALRFVYAHSNPCLLLCHASVELKVSQLRFLSVTPVLHLVSSFVFFPQALHLLTPS